MALANDPDGDPLTYAWDADGDGAFDDGNAEFLQFSYAEPRNYEVRVRVTDGKGGEKVAMQTLAVLATPGCRRCSATSTSPARIRVGRPAVRTLARTAGRGGGGVTMTFDLDGDGQFDETPTGGVRRLRRGRSRTPSRSRSRSRRRMPPATPRSGRWRSPRAAKTCRRSRTSSPTARGGPAAHAPGAPMTRTARCPRRRLGARRGRRLRRRDELRSHAYPARPGDLHGRPAGDRQRRCRGDDLAHG